MVDSWSKDHYPIFIKTDRDDSIKPLHAQIISKSDRNGTKHILLPYDPDKTDGMIIHDTNDDHDGYSNYIAHGLIPLFFVGKGRQLLPADKLSQHLLIASKKTSTKYGDSHRDGQTNVWVSQNMWRDLVALYLGLPLDLDLEYEHKYQALQDDCFQKYSSKGSWYGFCDSPVNSFLTSYSRGIPIIAFPLAKHHISYSKNDKTLYISPQTTAHQDRFVYLF